jgi:hypothetical protein
MEDINEGSLNYILREGDYNALLEEMKITPDHDDKCNLLEKYGYESDDYIGDKELRTVIHVIDAYAKTQKKFPTLKLEDKMKILFDFDKNGKLETGKNFYV